MLPEIIAFSSAGAEHPLAAEIIAATEAAGGEAIETDPGHPVEDVGQG